jgi:hypothetical protein
LTLSQVALKASELQITTDSGLVWTSIFLKASAPDGSFVFNQFKVKICGLESITAATYVIEKGYSKGSGI